MPASVKEAILQRAGLPANTALGDNTVAEGGVYMAAHFDVPLGTSQERIDLTDEKWRQKFGDELERQDFTVLSMSRPILAHQERGIPIDRTRYRLIAWCTRRPIDITVDLPDHLVPAALAAGGKLT